MSARRLRVALLAALAACGGATGERPLEVHVALATADCGEPWFPGVASGLPVLEIDAHGTPTLEGLAYDLRDVDTASARAYRARLTELRDVLVPEPLRTAGETGSAALPLAVLADRDARWSDVEQALVPTRYRGIALGHLALGVRDGEGALRRVSVEQAVEFGIACGPDVAEAWRVAWRPDGDGPALQLTLPMRRYPGMEQGPTRYTAEREAVGDALGDVLREARDAREVGRPSVDVTDFDAARWRDFVRLVELAQRAGYARVWLYWFEDAAAR